MNISCTVHPELVCKSDAVKVTETEKRTQRYFQAINGTYEAETSDIL